MGNCNNSKNTSSGGGKNKLNVHGHAEISDAKVTYKILLLGDAGVGKVNFKGFYCSSRRVDISCH